MLSALAIGVAVLVASLARQPPPPVRSPTAAIEPSAPPETTPAATAVRPAASPGQLAPAVTAARSQRPPPAPVPGSFALVQHFEGVVGTAPFDDGAPGPAIAAGPSALLLSTSDRLELRDRSGSVRASRSLLDFYTPLRTPRSQLKNPFAFYDLPSRRFVHVVSSRVPGPVGRSHILVALSRNDEPQSLGGEDWSFHAIGWTLEETGPRRNVFEWGRLAIGGTLVVVTAKTDPADETAPSEAVAKVLDNDVFLRNTDAEGKDLDPLPSVVLNPVRALEPTDAVYLLSRDGIGGSCGLKVWRIAGEPTNPSATSRSLPGRRECFRAPDAPQPDGPRPLDLTFESARIDAVHLSGRIFGAHTVSTRPTGEGIAVVRWFEIDVRRWPDVRFLQDSTISAEGVAHFYPGVAANPAGHLALPLVRSSVREFASLAYTGRRSDDPPNTLRPLALLQRGTGPVACADHTSMTKTGSLRPDFRNRFAVQSSAALDPVDGSAWLFGQYGRAGDVGCQFATWVGRLDWSLVPPR